MKVQYVPIAQAFVEVYGVKIHKVTGLRAIRRGLHALKFGNRWHTTVEAVKEYTEKVSRKDQEDSPSLAVPSNTYKQTRTEKERARDIELAKRSFAKG